MKTRNGFVSNSSSSSFTIKKNNLTPEQIEQIYEHVQWGRNFDISNADSYNEWCITEEGDEILGATSMDNFDMAEFFRKIGVRSKFVRWNDGEYEIDSGVSSWVKNIEYECPNCNNSFWGKNSIDVKCCPYCLWLMVDVINR